MCGCAHVQVVVPLVSAAAEELSCFIWDALRPPTVSSYRNATGERRETGIEQAAAERVMCIL